LNQKFAITIRGETMQPVFEELAQSLAKAWSAGGTIPLPAAEVAPRSRPDAFAIQDRMAEILGDRCVGWKVGAAVRAVQIMEGHDGPITGRLFAPRLYTSPAQLPAAMFTGYKIECEFAFRFKQNVPARERSHTRADLEPEVVLHPGLEVAGTRYATSLGSRKSTTHDVIADNGACGAYIVAGGVDDWRHIDLATLPIDARIDGGEPIRTFSGEYFRDPVDILVETVNGLSERGISLAAGDLLSTGSLTIPMPIQAGQTYVARFGDLAILSVSLR
jgi:2-keto-4-pentenoate hydratase